MGGTIGLAGAGGVGARFHGLASPDRATHLLCHPSALSVATARHRP